MSGILKAVWSKINPKNFFFQKIASLDRIITGQRARFLVEAHSNLKNDSVDNETAKIRGSIQALGHRNFSTPVCYFYSLIVSFS